VVDGRTLYYGRPLGGPADVEALRTAGFSEEAIAERKARLTFDYHERWLLPDQGLSVSRFRFLPTAPYTIDWYIETEILSIEGHLWTVRDGYLDLEVHEGQRYDLDDAEELGEGLASGDITPQEAATVLASLSRLSELLRRNGCSGSALLEAFAPGLPR
jgi:predicted RNA-binding protein associated with RNAse of E/G family